MIRYLKFDFFNCIKMMYCKNTVRLMRSYWEKGQQIYITISTFTSVCPFGVGVRRRRHVPLLSFQFLQAYDKVSLIKVGWYVLRVKNIHSWSPPDPLGPRDKEKVKYIHFNIRREEAKLCILKLATVFHHLSSVSPKQLYALAHLGCTREVGTF